MIRLIIKLLPYALCAVGTIGILAAIGTLTGDSPDQPVVHSIEDIEAGYNKKEPWQRAEGGWLLWHEACQLTKTRSGGESGVCVPYLSQGSLEQWQNPQTTRRYGLVAHFSQAELAKQFPRIADGSEVPGASRYALEFEARDVGPLFVSNTAEMKRDFLSHGFENLVFVQPGSKPMTKDEAPGAIFGGMVMAAGGVFWLVRRRRTRRIEDAALAGFSEGMRSAMSQVVREGVENAMKRCKVPLILACAALPLAATPAPAASAGSLPAEMREWKNRAGSAQPAFRARVIAVEIREGQTFITLEDEQGVKTVQPARDFIAKGDNYLAPFLQSARQNEGRMPASFKPALHGEMRVWTRMTVPFETKFRAQLVDAEIRGQRPIVFLRHETGEVKEYSGTGFFRRDDVYLKPFLAGARRVADPIEEAKKAAAIAAEKAAIAAEIARVEKRGYPKTPDPQWSPEKRAAYDAIIAADAAMADVNEQIGDFRRAQYDRRQAIREAHERNSANMAALSGIPGIAGPAPQLPGIQPPPAELIDARTALTARRAEAVAAFRGIEK